MGFNSGFKGLIFILIEVFELLQGILRKLEK